MTDQTQHTKAVKHSSGTPSTFSLILAARDLRIDDPMAKLLLVIYATRADKNGRLYPSYQTIMADTGIKSRSTISKKNNYLRELGVLDWQPGSPQRKLANLYQLNFQRITELVAKQKNAGDLPTSDSADQSTTRTGLVHDVDGTSPSGGLASPFGGHDQSTTWTTSIHEVSIKESIEEEIGSNHVFSSGDSNKSAPLENPVSESLTLAEGFSIAETAPQKTISCDVTPSPQIRPTAPLPHGDLEIAELKAAFDAAEPEDKRAAHQRWKDALEDNWREAQEGSAERLVYREAYFACHKASKGAPWRSLTA